MVQCSQRCGKGLDAAGIGVIKDGTEKSRGQATQSVGAAGGHDDLCPGSKRGPGDGTANPAGSTDNQDLPVSQAQVTFLRQRRRPSCGPFHAESPD